MRRNGEKKSRGDKTTLATKRNGIRRRPGGAGVFAFVLHDEFRRERQACGRNGKGGPELHVSSP